jgi:carbon-monoxide dehydrogenase medium subunit
MYPSEVDYVRATSVDEALTLLGQHDEAKLLAGGHSLIPLMKLRLSDPGTLIDIGRIPELKGISRDRGTVRIGALTTHAMIASSGDVPAGLYEAANVVADVQVRNLGTIGGNVVHADPASDPPTVLTALNATFHITGAGGERSVSVSDFFTGVFETAVGENEILTAIEVAAEPAGTGSAYAVMENPASGYAIEVAAEPAGTGSAYAVMENPASGYAMVGAAAVVKMSGGRCSSASVAVGGLTPKATRAPSVEAALVGNVMDESTIAAAAAAVQNDLGDIILGDMHAGKDYRKAMATVYVRRAVAAAVERAG